MGYPNQGESCGLRGGGCYQYFQGGGIYWSPATGAHFVRGLILQAWAAGRWEQGSLGYPRTDEICSRTGCWQQFPGGRLVWTPGRPVVRG